jgi:Holliday junction DNA helicase RuvA subunit
MIGYLKGKLLAVSDEGRWIILPEGSGVGYAVTVPNSAEYSMLEEGASVELHVHTHVREDALDLFGFRTRMEKDLFLTLTSVNGIGPRSAAGILAGIEAADLVDAILTENTAALVRIPGIGKKTAERVVLELREKVQKKAERGEWGRSNSGTHKSSGEGRTSKVQGSKGSAADDAQSSSAGEVKRAMELLLESKEALVSLGYREADSESVLRGLLKSRDPEQIRKLRVQDLVRESLKELR